METMDQRISYPPLVSQLEHRLLEGIVSGDLEPGCRLNESRLAKEMDMSRTPLREALHRLVGAGLIASEPRRGFFVPPLSRSEAEELYELVSLIESAAVDHSAQMEKVDLERLQSLTRQRAKSPDSPRRSLKLDRKWHSALLVGVENELLLEELSSLKRRLLRYELAFQHSTRRVDVAVEGHRAIESALERGRPDQVAQLLREHWENGLRLVRRAEIF